MKAVILAAGKGTRMMPLTEKTPKPLLQVAGKPIIQHNIDILKPEVEEIIIVAGYRLEQFQQRYSESEKVKIVEQPEPEGTADAALKARPYVEDAVILNGDDIYGQKLLELLDRDRAILAAETEEPEKYGVLKTKKGKVTGISEKPEDPDSNLVNTGCFKVDESFFELLEKVERSERGEYEITDALEEYIDGTEVVKTDRWLPCSYPWQLLEAQKELLQDIRKEINGDVHSDAEIKGEVVIEEGAKVKNNTTIEGPTIIQENSEIGPYAHIRPFTVIGREAHVGRSEVKNSVIGESSKIPHFNYIGDSYIGEQVNIGAGTKTANKRGDGKTVKVEVKQELHDTGLEKFGAVIADEAKIGMNCSIKPGRKIGSEAVTDSHEKIERNLEKGEILKDGKIL